MVGQVGLVGKSMKRIADVEVANAVMRLEDQKMDLQLKILDLDVDLDESKIRIYKSRITTINKRIEKLTGEKGVDGNEDNVEIVTI